MWIEGAVLGSMARQSDAGIGSSSAIIAMWPVWTIGVFFVVPGTKWYSPTMYARSPAPMFLVSRLCSVMNHFGTQGPTLAQDGGSHAINATSFLSSAG